VKLARQGAALVCLAAAGALLYVAIQAYILATEDVHRLSDALLITGVSLGFLTGFIDLWKSAVQTNNDAV
jgi:hypothetical protein